MSTPAAQIRLATIADANAIARMSRDTIETGLGWSWRPPRVLVSLRDPNTLSNVIGDNRVQGFCITQFGDEIAHLSLLAVDARLRRRGLGRKLVSWMLVCARTAGIATVHVEMRTTNLAARAFYRSLGFEDAGVVAGYYRGVESALRMVLSLRARDYPEVIWEPPLAWRRPTDS
ncbi:MAG: GNAT family N-acetyltransferase [Burkholderiales bacterium]|nr:GNAT family N-acetyltransferase [Burkholderiales bacterium]